ncbi:MAG TPA: sugar phosphate isomerase/epimerase [Bryobacteraceae bacterium]|jgi:sugar phosphate isomerase/epimerase
MPFTAPIGLQLYTLRNIMQDPDAVLKTVSEIGYTEVEILRATMDQIVPILKKYNLKPVSGHFETPTFTGDATHWQGFPAGYDIHHAVEDAQRWGLSYIVCPYIMPADRGGLDVYRKLADDLNRSGEVVSKAGMQLCYHNHAFEFKGEEGQRPFDILIERWDPKYVFLEADVFWLSISGQIPEEVLKKLSGRVPLIHLKDKAWATTTLYDESEARAEWFKEVGTGTIDFGPILRTAAKIGVKHYFVEQDQTRDPLASIRMSFVNLRKMNLAMR